MEKQSSYQQEQLPINLPNYVDYKIENAETPEDLGIRIAVGSERKDKGAISYTSVAETIRNWRNDPFGDNNFEYLASVFGLDKGNVRSELSSIGLEEYAKAKNEGRYVAMVATQILKPSYYFLTNPIILGQIAKRGIPTALMVIEYPEDKFFSGNDDKRDAFGTQHFVIEQDGQTKDLTLKIEPKAIARDDGSIIEIENINQANGYRCDQILVEVSDARGPAGQSYSYRKENGKRATREDAVLGYATGQDSGLISVTDLYKEMWTKTIESLRKNGTLPQEDEMPMFFVDGKNLYSQLAQVASIPKDVRQQIHTTCPEDVAQNILSDEDENNLTLLENGMLINQEGMMDPSCYYLAQTAFPDLYIECSSCGGDKFVNKIKRTQDVRASYGLPEAEVHLPHEYVEELEKLCIHPTGLYADVNSKLPEDMRDLVEQITELQEQRDSNAISKRQYRKQAKSLKEKLQQKTHQKQIEFERFLAEDELINSESRPTLPASVASIYRYLLEQK